MQWTFPNQSLSGIWITGDYSGCLVATLNIIQKKKHLGKFNFIFKPLSFI